MQTFFFSSKKIVNGCKRVKKVRGMKVSVAGCPDKGSGRKNQGLFLLAGCIQMKESGSIFENDLRLNLLCLRP